MMTFNELQELLTGETLYWNDRRGDQDAEIDHIVYFEEPLGVYEMHLMTGDEITLSQDGMEELATRGQATALPASVYDVGATLRWRGSSDVEKVTSDNANNAYIDWEQRTWDAALMLYCQMPDTRRFVSEALQDAKALIVAYRKLMKE